MPVLNFYLIYINFTLFFEPNKSKPTTLKLLFSSNNLINLTQVNNPDPENHHIRKYRQEYL